MSRGFHTDDYWDDDYDCPEDVPGYPGYPGEHTLFHTDDYWEGNDYDCPEDVPDYYGE